MRTIAACIFFSCGGGQTESHYREMEPFRKAHAVLLVLLIGLVALLKVAVLTSANDEAVHHAASLLVKASRSTQSGISTKKPSATGEIMVPPKGQHPLRSHDLFWSTAAMRITKVEADDERSAQRLQNPFDSSSTAVLGNAADREFNKAPEFLLPFALHECEHVFLDLGTRSGINLRTLFFDGPHSQTMWGRKFEKFFGANLTNRRRTVCVVATEANPAYKLSLDTLENELTSLGVKIKVIRNPVWVDNDILTLEINENDKSPLLKAGTKKALKVRGFRLSTLLAQVSPSGATVLVNFDLDGEEHRLISDLFIERTICKIDFYAIQFRRHVVRADRETLSEKIEGIQKLLIDSRWCDKPNGFSFFEFEDIYVHAKKNNNNKQTKKASVEQGKRHHYDVLTR
ncbi:membrane-associated protein, putative [Bodo saltans]|uniref:Membrane-associated protein, putative n=1 Tax=Bodo saltans TaxID=75058 RepID=A0A0S4J907_BODSA|nr:membrane-associated protein, putative [Bodo saltans]|eukprot:CUG86598.1 membrane-associated protein, putative [Bodo saltans]